MTRPPPPSRPGLHGSKAVAELKAGHAEAGTRMLKRSPRLKSRGRIEGASGSTSVGGTSTCLHGSKAVAELKVPVLLGLGVGGIHCLHGSKAVAELKGECWRGTLGNRRRLHGSKAVAELKGHCHQCRPGDGRASPRLKSRGRIEGTMRRRIRSWTSSSPRLKSRGRIEGRVPHVQSRRAGRVSTAQKPWPN